MGRNLQEMKRMSAAIQGFPVAAAIHFARGVIEFNNKGGDGAPPAPIDTGELRGSPRITLNTMSDESSEGSTTLTRPSDVAKAVQLGAMDVGDALVITWVAEHANIIEGGRRLDKRGRMIGSEQAPEGWVWPGVETMLSRMDRWKYQRRGGKRRRSGGDE